ncbi:cyclic nucleotide-binding domain-containing protein [Gallaecimonas kandeliae]|uniref:cyclic nucleotide-binding domain-containing protein n=1 Tax=Gallaecimonas kandeliae TaxID=3029055 RepID=UPI00264A0A94|nr:cyclic nucleotide-binding domain-containing protein [Gallaecimonas kandeliae]WKE64466.1 cyclic nucleotide-binding domain-containing protein [Gallaecimonas kandeliae]
MLAILDRIALFETLTQEEKLSLTRQGSAFFHAAKGASLLDKDSVHCALYILLAGRVRISSKGDEQGPATHGPGDFVGEQALFFGDDCSYQAHAVEDCILLCIDQRLILNLHWRTKDKIKDQLILALMRKVAAIGCNKEALLAELAEEREKVVRLQQDLLSILQQYPHIRRRIQEGEIAVSYCIQLA